jgi:hypothetical protein
VPRGGEIHHAHLAVASCVPCRRHAAAAAEQPVRPAVSCDDEMLDFSAVEDLAELEEVSTGAHPVSHVGSVLGYAPEEGPLGPGAGVQPRADGDHCAAASSASSAVRAAVSSTGGSDGVPSSAAPPKRAASAAVVSSARPSHCCQPAPVR